MRKIFILILSCLTISSFAQQRVVNGTWLGTLDAGISLRLVFNFIRDDAGALSGTVDSPDQGVKGLKCSSVSLNGDSLNVGIDVIKGNFKGQFINDSTITGSWSQGMGKLALTIKKVVSVPSIDKPQTPKPPFNYKSEDVEYDNADKTVHLGATLTYPNGSGPFPAVVLITGSGQQDRDETIGGHKMFAVLADHLTKNGFAVLRVDDRGTGKSTGEVMKATSADFAKDVEAGLQYLKSRKEIDKQKLGLIGHSEGGLIASIIGAANKDVKYMVLLAGPGTKGNELLADQAEAIFASSGIDATTAKAYRPFYLQIINNAVNILDTAKAIQASLKAYEDWKKTTPLAGRAQIGYTDDNVAKAIIQGLVKELSQPWLKFFLTSDPTKYLVQTNAKVLALNGEKDVQVVPKQNLAGIKAALAKSKSPLFYTKELKGLNHLFQTCINCTVQEYISLEETMSPAALEEISSWLNKNVKQ